MVRAGIILDNRKVRTMRTFCCICNLQKREIVLEYRMSSTDGRAILVRKVRASQGRVPDNVRWR